MKIAIVHDFLNQYGGAERVVEAIKEIYPEAPIYTSFYEPEKIPERMRHWQVITPRYTKNIVTRTFSKYFTFMLPLAFEGFDLRDYDVIISSTANFAKGVLIKPHQLHICYCHTPPRFLYHYPTEFNRRKVSIYKPFLMFLDNYFRIWDYLTAQRVDHFLTNAINTRKRINKFYRREATVIYPFVSLPDANSQYYTGDSHDRYFLVVSRLAAYKNIHLAIEACNKLKLNLKVIGNGRELSRLKRIAGETITFLPQVADKDLVNYYQNCEAVIFPGEDDFGIVPVEAMAFGKPVIAFGKGGALESVIPGKTGDFFYEENAHSLVEVLQTFDSRKYLHTDCQHQAGKFSKEKFQTKLKAFVEEKWKEKNA